MDELTRQLIFLVIIAILPFISILYMDKTLEKAIWKYINQKYGKPDIKVLHVPTCMLGGNFFRYLIYDENGVVKTGEWSLFAAIRLVKCSNHTLYLIKRPEIND